MVTQRRSGLVNFASASLTRRATWSGSKALTRRPNPPAPLAPALIGADEGRLQHRPAEHERVGQFTHAYADTSTRQAEYGTCRRGSACAPGPPLRPPPADLFAPVLMAPSLSGVWLAPVADPHPLSMTVWTVLCSFGWLARSSRAPDCGDIGDDPPQPRVRAPPRFSGPCPRGRRTFAGPQGSGPLPMGLMAASSADNPRCGCGRGRKVVGTRGQRPGAAVEPLAEVHQPRAGGKRPWRRASRPSRGGRRMTSGGEPLLSCSISRATACRAGRRLPSCR